ncbi:MAG: hypothetical protein U0547_12515 [Dehalococcoidia bacterium]
MAEVRNHLRQQLFEERAVEQQPVWLWGTGAGAGAATTPGGR